MKTPAFPSPYPKLLAPDTTFQSALDNAIAAGPGTSWRTPVAVVSLAPDGTRPVASFRGSEMHFSASLLKVAAMYAAFELRGTLRDIAGELGANATPQTFLKQAAAYLDPQIMAKAATIPALKGVAQVNAVPQYANAFAVTPLGSAPGVDVAFTSTLAAHLEAMIARSVNASAAECVHASGYGYLNGALASAGFFDPKTDTGVWLAGDYIAKYPAFRVPSVNDGPSAQATTVLDLAWILALIHDGTLAGDTSSSEMMDLLNKAVLVPEVFINRASDLDFEVTQTKVGLGSLKAGASVWSEGSILRHTSGRQFVAVWQNFDATNGFDPIGHVVRDAIDAYLAL